MENSIAILRTPMVFPQLLPFQGSIRSRPSANSYRVRRSPGELETLMVNNRESVVTFVYDECPPRFHVTLRSE